jgi:hypothetical protein
MYRVYLARHLALPGRRPSAADSLLVVGVEAREPGSQLINGPLGIRVLVDEVAQPLGQPAQRHLFGTTTFRELLDPAIGEVHASQPV